MFAPTPFQPTLVSDYFFNEPISPLPLHRASLNEETQQQHFPAADVYAPTDHHEENTHMSHADPKHVTDIPPPKSAAGAAAEYTMVVSSSPRVANSGVGSPTHPLTHFSSSPSTAQTSNTNPISSSTPASSMVNSTSPPTVNGSPPHQTLVAQALQSAALKQLQVNHSPSIESQPPSLPKEDSRKYSASSVTSGPFFLGGETTSATSTAPNSCINSPHTPSSQSMSMSVQSQSISQAQTPSPPPLTLPQAATVMPPVVVGAHLYSPDQPSHYVSSSTRTVPASSQEQNFPPILLPQAVQVTQPHVVPHAQTPPTHSKNSTHSSHHHHTHHHHHTQAHHGSNHQPHAQSHSYSLAPPIGTAAGVEYVGPFILGPVLGRGCTGTVRLGTHKRTNFVVAFKIIEKRYLQSDPKLWAKVKREIVILKLIEHPHVLKLYDVLETENRLYLVLEHVKGGELFDYIVSKGRLDRHESLRIAAQIVMGLEHCHKHNVCHRDLKPENLLLTEDKDVKIADFGMAQLMKKDGKQSTSCGSPHYAAPEVIEGRCLPVGTLVLLASGDSIACELVKSGMQLLGEDGKIARVAHNGVTVREEREGLFNIRSSNKDDSYQVTPNHRLTLRWNRSPIVTLSQASPSDCWILRVTWFDSITLTQKSYSWRAIPTDSILYAVSAVIEPSVSSSATTNVGTLPLLSSEHEISSQLLSHMSCAELLSFGQRCFCATTPRAAYLVDGDLIDLSARAFFERAVEFGIGSNSPVVSGRRVPVPIRVSAGSESSAKFESRIVYQLFHSSNCAMIGNSFCHLDRLHESLGIHASQSKNEVLSSATEQARHAAVQAVLESGATTVVAFGDLTKQSWMAIATQFHNQVEFVEDGLQVTRANGSTVSVWFTSLPWQWSQARSITQTIAKAHGVPALEAQFDSIPIVAIEFESGSHTVVNIEIEGKVETDKRFAIKNGILTHNSSGYDAKCTDVWSIGVILYALITGSLPFDHDNIPTLLTMVTKGVYTTPSHVPADVAHLISRMLTVDPNKRITLPEIRKHICFKGTNYFNTSPSDGLSVETMTHKLSRANQVANISLHKKQKHSRDRISSHHQSADSSDEEQHEHAFRKTNKGLHHSTSKDITNLSSVSVEEQRVLDSSHLDESILDEAVLCDLESLGLGPRDGNREELKRKVRGHDVNNKEPTLEQVFYKLLRQRKVDRLRELSFLSPKVSPQRPPQHFVERHHHHSHFRHSSHRHTTHAPLTAESQPSSSHLQPMENPSFVANSVPNSHAGSAFNSPAHVAATAHPFVELTLPPAVGTESAMMDISNMNHNAPSNGTSMYQPSANKVSSPPPARSAASPSSVLGPIQSSIFAAANAFASTLVALSTGASTPAQSDGTERKVDSMSDGMMIDGNAVEIMDENMFNGDATPTVPPSIVTPSLTIINAGVPTAVGTSCALTGMQTVAATLVEAANQEQERQNAAKNLDSSLPSKSLTPILTPPPMVHCYSDGAVPDSIMASTPNPHLSIDPTTGATQLFHPSSNVPAPLQLAMTQPVRAQSAIEVHTPSSTYDDIQVTTPSESSASFQYPAPVDSSANVSPAHKPTSFSAQVSPVVHNTQRNAFMYNRRMSTPQVSSMTNEAGVYLTNSNVARQLFASDDMSMNVDDDQSSSLDHFGQQMNINDRQRDITNARDAHGMDTSDSQSSMQISQNFPNVPPPLTLPRVAAPTITVPVESGASSSESDNEPSNLSHSSIITAGTSVPAEPSGPHHPSRYRAYSQDESNLLMMHHHSHATDRIDSNVRTPLMTPMTGETPNSAYSGTIPTRNASGPAGTSIQKVSSALVSPQHKKSWFSSVFTGSGLSFFDRLKGKRPINPSTNAASAASNARTSPSSQVPPSPLMSPARMAASKAGTSTKKATLTLTNELTKLFQQAQIQFVHHGNYKFGASYAPSNPPSHMVPPLGNRAMPSQMPLLQRAMSTPEENAPSGFRPRSKSIAIESPVGSPSRDNVDYTNAFPISLAHPPSTPKPTPTRRLGEAFVPTSVLPVAANSSRANLNENAPPTFNRANSNSSSSRGSSRDSSVENLSSSYMLSPSTEPSSAAAGLMGSPPASVTSNSSAASMNSPAHVNTSMPSGSPSAASTPSSLPATRAMFGANPVRFTVQIFELPGDRRSVCFLKKSGDQETLDQISKWAVEQMHL